MTASAVDLMEMLSTEGARLQPIFDSIPERSELPDEQLTNMEQEDISRYYRVLVSEEKLDQLAERLREQSDVEAAFIKPDAEPAVAITKGEEAATETTPDYTIRQGYLKHAPEGVDAYFAWTLPGGKGAGVQIIDIEGGWQFSHEDLLMNQGGLAGGVSVQDTRWRNHGTAVLGEVSGDENGFGIKGICPDGMIKGISIFEDQGQANSARAIVQAAQLLNPGDIILIELHRPGPQATGRGQEGYIPIEWWPDDFEAIQYACRRGIIVVEAAGNGNVNLDDPIYNEPDAGFPRNWKNPFNRNNRDSGAIVVGAGAPPEGTHNRNHGPDRSRLEFSNYGEMVDVQGWGREVTTTGYGDLQQGNGENQWYTDTFSGTSSASPIIVGVLGCLQGVLRGRNKELLTWERARELLRSTGSPQQDAPLRPRTQRIGNRPDLRQLMGRIL
ncbi:serine protease [Paenibacillus oralis]|uniref:Serine protease n=2 Tax=Paenibacillus oralis TaxID=2490856 RepID=A0A3P3UBP4_9BACL|nr:serine protease [Paenibacillus oralis]